MGIYHNESRLKTALAHLKASATIPPQNKEQIEEFLTYIRAHGCSVSRQIKYIYPLQKLSGWLGKEFTAATKQDIERLLTTIKAMTKPDGTPKYSAWTQQDYMVTIKKFYTWLYNRQVEDEDEWDVPKLVKFIKIRKPRDADKLPSELLSPDDVKRMAQHAKTLREKALVLTLYESGARISELLHLKLRDVQFDQYGALLNLNGKTGYRKIRIIGSAPALSQWINHEHPKRTDRNAYLFCTIQRGKEGGIISYMQVKTMLNTIKERAGIDKNVRPHIWRHSRATEMAEHLSDSVRCQYFGWVQGSKMARVYTHIQDTDRIILELNGLIEKTKDHDGRFETTVCPRCQTKNPYGSDYCANCNMGLNMHMIEKLPNDQVRQETVAREMKQLQHQVDSMQEAMKQIVAMMSDDLSEQLERKKVLKDMSHLS